jgi:hypothetical protein
MIRAFITMVTIIGLLMVSFGQQKEASVQEIVMKGKEIFLRQSSAQVVQLTRDEKPKYDVQLSPEKQWVVYNGDSILNEESPAVAQFVFTVIDLKEFTRREISFHTLKGTRIETVDRAFAPWMRARKIKERRAF